MIEAKVNDTYCDGYEGYPIILMLFENSTERNILKMWNGYFETLLDLMCHYESTDIGILQEYYSHEGWYEESPWEIQDLDSSIHLFKSFNVSTVTGEQIENVKNIVPTLPEAAHQISTFFRISQNERLQSVY